MTKSERYLRNRIASIPDFFVRPEEMAKHGFDSRQVRYVNHVIAKRLERGFKKEALDLATAEHEAAEKAQAINEDPVVEEKAAEQTTVEETDPEKLAALREYGYSHLYNQHFDLAQDAGDNDREKN